MVVIIRLTLYIDLIFTDKLGHVHANPEGKTINTMVSLWLNLNPISLKVQLSVLWNILGLHP